ncbi:MoaD/ThiS family protein [Pelagibius sp. Alg239-R121]|uniref:MoaD/ThiS family protein n=1 Tax=Pelagibius sp. Alg239-R121 TaxID=2993448 RepID=UPI0024A68333|nr:MoaD/ThiS family protein [Pelagibius sp. Alg239-R121]
MVEVNLWSGLKAFTDGQEKVEIDAKNVGEVLRGLVQAYPGLEPAIEAGVSVAVDGRIVASSLTEPVSETSEVYLIQRLRGG